MIFNKKIGIWGFGVVGKAACTYLYPHAASLEVLEAKEPTISDQKLLQEKNIPLYKQENYLATFLEHNDYILASPGIDLRPYAAYAHKWITELDVLQEFFKKPIIAVTGSVGKTSVTSMLSQLMQHGPVRWYTGGNIGAGMLELLANRDEFDAALLEVSSFQLEQCRTFGPDLAIWTTFYPNHLDRHGSLQNYFDAKFTMIKHQTASQIALVPITLLPHIQHKTIQSQLCFFSAQKISATQRNELSPCRVFCLEENNIVLYHQGVRTEIFGDRLPAMSFKENWLMVISTLFLIHDFFAMPQYVNRIYALCDAITLPEHRLEKVAMYHIPAHGECPSASEGVSNHTNGSTRLTTNGVVIYNDSKSTTIESTLAAVQQLQGGSPITIFLGGLSKGVNREPLIKALKDKVVAIYCFGKEAEQLKSWADGSEISAWSFANLDEAVAACIQNTKEPAQILFSPAGSSYDLFKNYIERGTRFKELVKKHYFCD